MDDAAKIDVGRLLSYSDDLVSMLKEKRELSVLHQCLDQFKALRVSSDAGYNDSRSLLEDYQRKIDECKQKTEKARLEVSGDDELDLLQKELELEHEKECRLIEEIRVINGEINDLERRRNLVEERKQTPKKQEQEELKAMRLLSMYASVTTVIPNLDDHSKISGHIVDRGRRKVGNFEFDPTKETFNTCQSIWKMIDL